MCKHSILGDGPLTDVGGIFRWVFRRLSCIKKKKKVNSWRREAADEGKIHDLKLPTGYHYGS
jgi:hypothetical protein